MAEWTGPPAAGWLRRWNRIEPVSDTSCDLGPFPARPGSVLSGSSEPPMIPAMTDSTPSESDTPKRILPGASP